MEIRYLKSFIWVAETLSFSIAAQKCCITQSAVSQHIKMLENEMGCKLILRSSHKLELTECGQIFLAYAKNIINQADDCKEQIHAINNCMIGELRIGVGSFIAPYIRHAITLFMERYPGVMLNCEYNKACRLNEALRIHNIDLAFTMNKAFPSEGIESLPCIPFSLYVFVKKSHILARQQFVSYSDILKHPVIMPDVGDRVFTTFQQYINCDLTKLNVKCIIGDPDEALAVVEDTNYITFMPKLYLQHHPSLTARPIIGLEETLQSNAHWMKDIPLKRTAQIFLDIIKNEAVPYISSMEQIYD